MKYKTMIRKGLTNFYEVMFNFFVKKDGYNSTSHILPACIVGLHIVFLFVTITCIFSLTIGKPYIYHEKANKALIFILIAIYFLIIYIVLFYGFKLAKSGSGKNHRFLIDKNIYLQVWLFFFINIFVFIVAIFFTLMYVKP